LHALALRAARESLHFRQEPPARRDGRNGTLDWGLAMRTESSGNTPWDKIRKFLANPTVEVLLAILAMFVAMWVVIESEDSLNRRNASALPVLFGYK
jgi:hypothetical protein